MSGSIVIFSVACLLLIDTATAQDGFFSTAGSGVESGFGSFAGSSFSQNFGEGGFDPTNLVGDLLKPGSNFVGAIVTSTVNADGTTEITHKVTDGMTSVLVQSGDVTDSEIPVVEDLLDKVVPEVIEKVTDDLNSGLGIEKIVDNVVDKVGDVVDDARMGKVVGPLLFKILTNRRILRAVIKVLVVMIRLGVL